MQYSLKYAQTDDDLYACQLLRGQAFLGQGLVDQDAFDLTYQHVMIEEAQTGALVATARFLLMENGSQLPQSYSAEFYHMNSLTRYAQPIVDLGRICFATPHHVEGAMRLLWAELTCLVDAHGVGLLCGCTSFTQGEGVEHQHAFAALAQKAISSADKTPTARQPYAPLSQFTGDVKRGVRELPSILTTYLHMGGWVGPDVVQDDDLQTYHVFTGLYIDEVPPARAKALRLLAKALCEKPQSPNAA